MPYLINYSNFITIATVGSPNNVPVLCKNCKWESFTELNFQPHEVFHRNTLAVQCAGALHGYYNSDNYYN